MYLFLFKHMDQFNLVNTGLQNVYFRKNKRHKLRHRKFRLNMRKNFFPLRMTEHWNRQPREVVVEYLLLWRYSRPTWTRSCSACCRWPFFGREGWTRWSPEVPSNPCHSVILRFCDSVKSVINWMLWDLTIMNHEKRWLWLEDIPRHGFFLELVKKECFCLRSLWQSWYSSGTEGEVWATGMFKRAFRSKLEDFGLVSHQRVIWEKLWLISTNAPGTNTRKWKEWFGLKEVTRGPFKPPLSLDPKIKKKKRIWRIQRRLLVVRLMKILSTGPSQVSHLS